MLTLDKIFANALFDDKRAWLLSLGDARFLEFGKLQTDSRRVKKGDAFALLQSQDPSRAHAAAQGYLDQVAGKAAFVLSQIPKGDLVCDAPFLYAPDLRDFLGDLLCQSAQLCDPLALPRLIATTGTNGKTTISHLVAALLSDRHKAALMGTAGNGIFPDLRPSLCTTPDVLAAHQAVRAFAKQGVEVVALEASSHGLDQRRLQGLPIEVAVFSNLSRDHLDYHADMDAYAAAKATLFDKARFRRLGAAAINVDDPSAESMLLQAKKSGLRVLRYSLKDKSAEFFATDLAPFPDGVRLRLATPVGDFCLKSPLLGRFNVANLLAAIAAAYAFGDDLGDLPERVLRLLPAKGRMQKAPSDRGVFLVDYAHTPDAIDQALAALRWHCKGRLWAVFGAGGDRDKGKRPLMTKAALKWADRVVLTSDNPRSEDPKAILDDMQADLTDAERRKIRVVVDRREAIDFVARHAQADDATLIAGKGHESYQEINGARYDFDDFEVLQNCLAVGKR